MDTTRPQPADPAPHRVTLETRLAAVPGPILLATLRLVDPSTLSREDAATYLAASDRATTWLEDRRDRGPRRDRPARSAVSTPS